MSITRRSAVRTYHRFYQAITQPACVYCGLRATTKDHFVPVSVVSMLIECAEMHEGLFLLPSCGECNVIASDNIFKTVAAKRRYIQARLRQKYKRVLAMPEWDEKEMEDVGWTIESFVKSGMAQKALLLQRLAWRNTSNSTFVSIAKIRSGVLGHGQSSVRATANNNTPIKKEKKIKSTPKIFNLRCINCNSNFKSKRKAKFCFSICARNYARKIVTPPTPNSPQRASTCRETLCLKLERN